MTDIMDIFEFLEPWEALGVDNYFENELYKEISSEHVLFGLKVKAVAKRCDRDDILFKIINRPDTYAKVHLTGTGRKESNTQWPTTTIFNSFEEWVERCMMVDKKSF